MPGVPRLAAGRGASKAKRRRRARAGAVSGNPAKAAAEAKAAPGGAAAAPAANPFGMPGGEEIDYETAAAALDLPQDFSKFLK